ncbi:MAG: hypothetical protein IT210_20415 [Armatimonadetes bacterium]|nr:hypothetical protein [Armatimonadota bacterium]
MPEPAVPAFEGQYYSGTGDADYLEMLDIARRMFAPDPVLQNASMIYEPRWNGLSEGPTWNAWWIQNSYGLTYSALPFYTEPFTTFLQNSQDMWFDRMGDGRTRRAYKYDQVYEWVAPDGSLCDAATPEIYYPKQGDGRVDIHDWGMEFTAAGLLMQAELLLISRAEEAVAIYLPKLERCADFIESRRDPRNDLFLAGPAGNLLAPSYAGWQKPDGAFDKAYLAGLSITYIAALDRLIELETMAGNEPKAALYAERRERARQGLPLLQTEEGYFIKSLDPDGTRHGVYGAEKHGYFESVCNHDAIAFRVADDVQAEKIYRKIASIPGLRPHHFIITNYPGLDDMYVEPTGIWEFGMWVNGGNWSTCEARMILGYYRLGQYADALQSMRHLYRFARRFQLDNPYSNFGGTVSWYRHPIYITCDTFGVPAAFVRGLFEYLYRADGLRLRPHIPPGITRLEQKFPIRFGQKRLYLATTGSGPITGVRINGKPWQSFDAASVFLPDSEEIPETACIRIGLGGSEPEEFAPAKPVEIRRPDPQDERLKEWAERITRFRNLLLEADLQDIYEEAHARLALECMAAAESRRQMKAEGRIELLPEPSRSAADESFATAALRICEGLQKTLGTYGDRPEKEAVYRAWMNTADIPPPRPY